MRTLDNKKRHRQQPVDNSQSSINVSQNSYVDTSTSPSRVRNRGQRARGGGARTDTGVTWRMRGSPTVHTTGSRAAPVRSSPASSSSSRVPVVSVASSQLPQISGMYKIELVTKGSRRFYNHGEGPY